MFRRVVAGYERDARLDGSSDEVFRELAAHRTKGDDACSGELLFDLTTNVRGVPGRPLAAEAAQHGLDDGSAVQLADPCAGWAHPPAGWPEPETAELLDPAPAELDAVARDHLVGSRFGPGATVPGHPELAAGLLVRMLGAPLGFVPVDVGGDLPGACREAADVRSQLHDLPGLRVQGVPVGGKGGPELGVAHDGRMSDAVDRAEAVSDADRVQTSPPLPHSYSCVDLQVEVAVRVACPGGVVTHDDGFDLVDGHLHLKSSWTDAGGGVLGDPRDDLLGCSLLGCVIGRRHVGMKGRDQGPCLRPVDGHLREPDALVVRAEPAFRLARCVVPGDPRLVGIAVQRRGVSDRGSGLVAARDVQLGVTAALGQVVVIGTRAVGLDVVPRRRGRASVDLQSAMHTKRFQRLSITTNNCPGNANSDRPTGDPIYGTP